MFTGIIQAIGEVASIDRDGESARIRLRLPLEFGPLDDGESLAVDGACLTATERATNLFTASVSWETLARTTLGGMKPGAAVNLERALRPIDRLGGHFVSGHIDGLGQIRSLVSRQDSWELSVAAPEEILAFCVEKGSVAVDGVSLTIATLDDSGFTCALIPHTYEHTTLCMRHAGDSINLEADLIGKYIRRFLRKDSATPGGVTWKTLEDAGFV